MISVQPPQQEQQYQNAAFVKLAWYRNADCQKLDWVHIRASHSQAGCQLIEAITESNGDVVTRLAKTKRVLNGIILPTRIADAPDDESMFATEVGQPCISAFAYRTPRNDEDVARS
jgi:hypothetical protein